MLESAFSQIALILVVAAVVGFLANLLRQPLIVAYMFVGILLGPAFLGLVSAGEEIELLAKFGIAILLFLVGLKLDVGLIRLTGFVALATGIAQVVVTLGIGFLIVLAWGFDWIPALYVALALAFSSTIIIIKVLSDKRELDQLHGQIAVGVLIVQDILVIVAMVVIASVGSPDGSGASNSLVATLLGSVGFLGVVALLARFVIPRLLSVIARSQELTLLFGVGWAMSLAATSQFLGLSMEIGAFVAGVALASTPYRESLSARMVSLRDIMILFFFIELGTSLSFEDAGSQIGLAVVLSAFVLVVKPLVVMVIMGALGYRSQVSFKSGFALAQISEFSLILIALGYSLGQVGSEVMSLVTLVAIITITLSTYFILYSDRLYQWMSPVLRRFDKSASQDVMREESQAHPIDAIVIGAGRLGSSVVAGLREKGGRLLVVDQDPRALRAMEGDSVETLFGDISDPDFSGSLPLNIADAVICTVHDRSTNLVLLETLSRFNFEGKICLTAMDEPTAKMLSENRNVTVIRPLTMAATRIVDGLPKMRQRGEPRLR
ncbi:MAG: sodium:proton exchanger [Microbacteriaceae bacterium]|nr:sodium:proton exchanger [Microbacteriaceae bacterium]